MRSYSDYEQQILKSIGEDGWFCVSVSDPEGDALPFTYSVGFTQTLSSPEFIVFGLDGKLSYAMLKSVFSQIRDGARPADGMRWDNVLRNCGCISRKVHPTNIVREHFNSAMWFWKEQGGQGPLQAYQLVWPAAQTGEFPWEAGCPEIVRDYQPPLYVAGT